jgi:uncharacterized protein
MSSSLLPKVVIVPGNGCTNIAASNWYSFMQTSLLSSGLCSDVVMMNMPDPFEAKRELWIPFIKDQLIAPQETTNAIVIGHSSGAVAAMRLLEDTQLLGCVLVSACHTDMGEASERVSGYYPGWNQGKEDPNPWHFDKIRSNASWILQYHSSDDPFIPREQADYVAEQLGAVCEYTCYKDKSHFFSDKDVIPIIEDIKGRISKN